MPATERPIIAYLSTVPDRFYHTKRIARLIGLAIIFLAGLSLAAKMRHPLILCLWVVGFFLWVYYSNRQMERAGSRRTSSQPAPGASRQQPPPRSEQTHTPPPRAESQPQPRPAQKAPTPWETLGLPPGATQTEIQTAYREMISQYHPDKVAHLGAELRELASRKSTEINQAYARLRQV
jgi:hypothetical protein